MPATTKKKRKIHVNGRDFYWTGDKLFCKYVTIMTSDKHFFAKYHLSFSYDQFMKAHLITGKIVIENANIPELSHVHNGLEVDTPEWSELYYPYWATPEHIRRAIVYIFETLK